MNTGKRSGACLVMLPESKRLRWLDKELDAGCKRDKGVEYGLESAKRDGGAERLSFGNDDGYCFEETSDRNRCVRRSCFENLPMEILIIILAKVAASADSALDFLSVLATCRDFNNAGGDSEVLSHASLQVFVIGIQQWCESAYRFFKRCADAGNVEACYSLGMIHFYCLENRRIGLFLMTKAAKRSHAQSLYSLAIIKFNGSGSPSKKDKDLCLGAALCSRAAFLRNVDALQELGHCFRDGYGVRMDLCKGRQLLIEAYVQELKMILESKTAGKRITDDDEYVYLLSDLGAAAHPVNRFLRKWWEGKLSTWDATKDCVVRLCSNGICGRVETRKHEFRQCSVCGMVNYCSRACQAIDWKAHHKAKCIPTALYLLDLAGGAFFDVET